MGVDKIRIAVSHPALQFSNSEDQTLSGIDRAVIRGEDFTNNDGEKADNSHPSDGPSKMSTTRRRVIMLSLCLAQFLSALDITIVATALPTIADTLQANAAEYAWVGSSYTLANTASTPIWAKLSDIWGRKLMLMISNAVFMAGSLVAALSQTPSMLIGGRLLQGLGGGGTTVLVTIVIGDLFELKNRAKYYGLTGLVYAVSSSVGPILGGIFTSTIGWRWCFYINLPFDAASLVLLFFAFKVKTPDVKFIDGLKSFDWVGTILVIGGTICFLLGLETGAGGAHSWGSAMVICLLTFGSILLALFFIYETYYAKNPLMPTRIFASATNLASFSVSCLHSFSFIAYDYFLPLYYQVVLGFSPIVSGATMLALVIPLSVATMSGGWIVRKSGDYQKPIWAGAVLMTLGTGLFINFDSTTNWTKIILFEIITGTGAGPLFQAPMIALQSHVRPEDVAMASSAMSFSKSLFSSLSIVIGSVILQRTLGGGSLTLGTATSDNLDEGTSLGDKGTYTSALRIMWTFFTCMCALILIASFFIKKGDLLEAKIPLQASEPEKRKEESEDV